MFNRSRQGVPPEAFAAQTRVRRTASSVPKRQSDGPDCRRPPGLFMRERGRVRTARWSNVSAEPPARLLIQILLRLGGPSPDRSRLVYHDSLPSAISVLEYRAP